MSHDAQLIISQKKLALLLGGLAIALPSTLYLGNLYIFGVTHILSSISSYYHSQMRDVFVGSLFVMGFFLISYEGYSPFERLFSSLGGVLALLVALFPTPMTDQPRELPGTIHLVSAGTFYLILAFFCLFQFTKSDPNSPKTVRKRIRNFIYRLAGLVMIASLVLLILTELKVLLPPIDTSTFWLEYLANIAFGTAWLIKGEGIFLLNDDPILEMNPWEISGILILLTLAFGSFLMLTNIFIIF